MGTPDEQQGNGRPLTRPKAAPARRLTTERREAGSRLRLCRINDRASDNREKDSGEDDEGDALGNALRALSDRHLQAVQNTGKLGALCGLVGKSFAPKG